MVLTLDYEDRGRESPDSEPDSGSGSEFEPPEVLDEDEQDEQDEPAADVLPPIIENREDVGSDAESSLRNDHYDGAKEDEDEPEVIEAEHIPASLAWYQRELTAHTLNSQQHFAGLHSESYAGDDFKRSFVGSEAWSGSEKAAFFAAIARHSRWRPDLIAEDCGKSEHAVRLYIEQLERGQRRTRRRPTDDTDSREVVEVSSAFVEREEGFAAELLSLSQPKQRINAGYWSWTDDLRGQLSSLQQALDAEEEVQSAPIPVIELGEDDLAIQALQSIPKLTRTAHQKKQLRHLLNRKRNRTAYRRKILRSEGWTDERIAEGGGADTVFEREQELKARDKRPGAKRKVPADVPGLPMDAAAKSMKDCGAVKAVKDRGLDVFDYNTLALYTGERQGEREQLPNGVSDEERQDGEVLEVDDPDELDSNSDTGRHPPAHQSSAFQAKESDEQGVLLPSINLPVMQHLYAEMLAYLKPLIYQAIVIAEAQSRQVQSEEPGVTASHVLAALRLRDQLEVDSDSDSAFSSPTSAVSDLPSTAESPEDGSTRPKRRLSGSLSPISRAEAQLPTWGDFPPPLPYDSSPVSSHTPLSPESPERLLPSLPLSPETPTRPTHPRWEVDNTPQPVPEFSLLSPDTTTSGPSRTSRVSGFPQDELPSFPIAHPEPNYLDEGTDEEDEAIEAALRRYHKSADRAWDRLYAHGLRNAAKPDPFATPTPFSQSQSRRSTPRSRSRSRSRSSRSASLAPEPDEEARRERKRQKRAQDKLDRASERAEDDFARYASVRDTLLRRRERRRAQLKRLKDTERTKKRRRLKPPADEFDDEEGEVVLPEEERGPILDEIIGTTDEEDEEGEEGDGEGSVAGILEADGEDADGEEAVADDPAEEAGEDGALDEDENEDEKEERLHNTSDYEDEKEEGAAPSDESEDESDGDGALDEDEPEADGALDEDEPADDSF
ncbi:hypothetical protein A1Q1_04338 [Trichosporon asahii var. asahii CBS 2479]|uniref:Uncharacterized protein n=1 Tax=Trichosporon asahii var. asahii (strain ATCC 90039 / CBS 2479 / JCM 2466 / KCTC 7840 / NBRC 103889/ NCYC 2677 / UAMH 7654) TaxID=1186058 RepID=J5TRW7_TRIAS|nr:hypothetical protein A1Q1_04338 [Trichosporon asahii var. asahii CBS 2479]EJT52431.1 hypothetical protein A1Q1_04338 [Trichosporon asahii var. asahii CBS 2479]